MFKELDQLEKDVEELRTKPCNKNAEMLQVRMETALEKVESHLKIDLSMMDSDEEAASTQAGTDRDKL